MRLFLLLEAMFTLMRFEFAARRGFGHVHVLMSAPIRRRAGEVERGGSDIVRNVCIAVDTVCSFYPKSVLCLQRAGLVASMLKKRGLAAEVVIGIKKFPFQAHAWVEIDQRVVNDHLQVRDKYLPIERYGADTAASVNTGVPAGIQERGV